MNAIEKLLDRKLQPLSQHLKQIHLDLDAFKQAVKTEFESMGMRIMNVENQASDALTKVTQLEQELANMKMQGVREASNKGPLSTVIGNIPNVSSFDEAKVWLNKHCSAVGLPPIPGPDVYCKGSFSGLLFVKCQNEGHRDQLIQSIRDTAKQSRETNGFDDPTGRLFAKFDLPLDVRTVEGALHAMKRMLVSWNFNPAAIKFDTDKGTLTVASKNIVKIWVENFTLKFKWCDGEWQAWKELHDSMEMVEIQTKATSRLEKAKARASNKGKGKGPE